MSGSDDMRPAGSGVRLTYDDFLLLPDDGKRHEVIDGEHYVTPSPNRKHQAIVWNLAVMIGTHLDRHPIGRAFTAPFDVVFSAFDVVEPDLLYVSGARAGDILTTEHVSGAPDLVVEVGSPGTRRRDQTIKRRLYERCAVAEYWVIDPELDSITVYRRTGDRYERAAELTVEEGGVLATPLLPGLRMPLVNIFKD